MASVGPKRGRQNFHQEICKPEAQIDLARAALYVAQEAYPSLEPETYLAKLDGLATTIESQLPSERYPLRVIQTINRHLFERQHFRGNTDNYYDPRNSFLNEVLERRVGIPITLSLVYIEVARRLQFPMVGVGMPGHFLIRPDIAGIEFCVDSFHGGEVLFPQDCEARLQDVFSQPIRLRPEFLAPISKRALLARLLTNLKYIYTSTDRFLDALAAIERLLLLNPGSAAERRDRGLISYRIGRFERASQDLEDYLAAMPQARDANTIRAILSRM